MRLFTDITGKKHLSLLLALVLTGMASVFFFDESLLTTIEQTMNNSNSTLSTKKRLRSSSQTHQQQQELLTSSCTQFRKYPFPEHHSGLPHVGDVFASHNGTFVNFIAINRGECQEEWRNADLFAAEWHQEHRFICVFNKDTFVLSDVVHVTQPFRHGYIVKCKIPQQYRHLIQPQQKTTSLHVDLHAMEDLEMNRTGPMEIRQYPSMEVTDTPAITNIPICHPIISGSTVIQPNQFNLTAMTRIKSSYPLSHFHPEANATVTSPISRLLEWIDYHEEQGFDHFVIYDNDEQEHGPIEQLLQPYIQSGLVTYRWFPLEDCWVDFGDWKDYLFAAGQMVASLSALHRMSFATRFYAHMDVDEFFIPRQENKTVLDIVMEGNETVDAFMWKPTLMAPCNGTTVSAAESVLEKWKCLTETHYADQKLIMRADRMLYFFVHYPVVTVDGMKPIEYMLNETTQGFLAHYRSNPGDGPESTWNDAYSGLVLNDFNNEVCFMDDFLEKRQEKMNMTATNATKMGGV